MTYRDSEKAVRTFASWLVAVALIALVAALPAHAATLEVTLRPTTTDELGAPLPATGPGALTQHRVEYGTCVLSGTTLTFGTAMGSTIVVMPILEGSFTVQPGTYCVRAFASNVYGEGKPYPIGVIGTRPGDAGDIIVLRQSQ